MTSNKMKMTQFKLLEFVQKTYPCENKDLYNFLHNAAQKNQLNNWRDFSNTVTSFEKMQNLNNEKLEELNKNCGIWNLGFASDKCISVKQIIFRLQKEFPV